MITVANNVNPVHNKHNRKHYPLIVSWLKLPFLPCSQ